MTDVDLQICKVLFRWFRFQCSSNLDGLIDSVPALWIMIALFKNTRPPLCQPADAFDDRERARAGTGCTFLILMHEYLFLRCDQANSFTYSWHPVPSESFFALMKLISFLFNLSRIARTRAQDSLRVNRRYPKRWVRGCVNGLQSSSNLSYM